MRGDEADITCNECGSVVRTVRAQEAGVVEALMMEVVAGAI